MASEQQAATFLILGTLVCPRCRLVIGGNLAFSFEAIAHPRLVVLNSLECCLELLLLELFDELTSNFEPPAAAKYAYGLVPMPLASSIASFPW